MTFDLQFFGGNGAKSGRRSGGGASTPSGVTYDQFMKMSMDERYDTMAQIIDNPDITVPDYLDKSVITKVMYAIGMNNKPTIVSDTELDKMKGKVISNSFAEDETVIYRGIKSAELKTGKKIAEEIINGDYTQFSNTGGSMFGRAIYFTTSFGQAESASIDDKDKGAVVRAKVKPNANILYMSDIKRKSYKDSSFQGKVQTKLPQYSNDDMALYAIANGIQGWFAHGTPYVMIVDRSALNISSTVKNIKKTETMSVFNWENAQSI